MCGIAGKITFNGSSVTESDLLRMAEAIKHRGPDDAGTYMNPHRTVGLAHRRLAIIDLSQRGKQPMSFQDRYFIVFNGEIYNFQAKRRELEAQGYGFKTQTDTEVILALYDRYGLDCPQHLRGMFAFAIYDVREDTLFCARDRVGKKPFKYYYDDHVFLFASELKSLLTQPECPRQPDELALHHFLTLQYAPAPLTGFKGIKKLEPGHYLFINRASKSIQHRRYWQLRYAPDFSVSEHEWCERIRDTVREAVRLRMIADVPVGAFLSGGIDSSVVVALMSQLSTKPIKTFSIGFKEQRYNELPYARQIAQRFATDHTEWIVEPKAMEVLPHLIYHYEEPYADSSALPTYYVSKLTRNHVTVALNGDGGDESFAGYGRYSVQQFSDWYERFRFIHMLTALPATAALKTMWPNTFTDRAYRFARSLQQPYDIRYTNYVCYFSREQKTTLYTDEFAKRMMGYDTYDLIARRFRESNAKSHLNQTLYTDVTTYLPDDLLTKVDIATMAVSLEGRSPLLDHHVMELAATIPPSLKLRGLNNKKYIFRQAFRGLLPATVLDRSKRGFGVPIDEWFRGELKDFVHDIITSQRAVGRGLFRRSAIESIFKQHTTTRTNYAHHLWTLLTLELWFRRFIDQKP